MDDNDQSLVNEALFAFEHDVESVIAMVLRAQQDQLQRSSLDKLHAQWNNKVLAPEPMPRRERGLDSREERRRAYNREYSRRNRERFNERSRERYHARRAAAARSDPSGAESDIDSTYPS